MGLCSLDPCRSSSGGTWCTGQVLLHSFCLTFLSPLHQILVSPVDFLSVVRDLTVWPLLVVYLVFRFVTGFCGAAFLSVAGGRYVSSKRESSLARRSLTYPCSVSPTFSVTKLSYCKFQECLSPSSIRVYRPLLSRPMAVYSASPLLGPVLGPALSGFINQVSSHHAAASNSY